MTLIAGTHAPLSLIFIPVTPSRGNSNSFHERDRFYCWNYFKYWAKYPHAADFDGLA